MNWWMQLQSGYYKNTELMNWWMQLQSRYDKTILPPHAGGGAVPLAYNSAIYRGKVGCNDGHGSDRFNNDITAKQRRVNQSTNSTSLASLFRVMYAHWLVQKVRSCGEAHRSAFAHKTTGLVSTVDLFHVSFSLGVSSCNNFFAPDENWGAVVC